MSTPTFQSPRGRRGCASILMERGNQPATFELPRRRTRSSATSCVVRVYSTHPARCCRSQVGRSAALRARALLARGYARSARCSHSRRPANGQSLVLRGSGARGQTVGNPSRARRPTPARGHCTACVYGAATDWVPRGHRAESRVGARSRWLNVQSGRRYARLCRAHRRSGV